MDMAQFRRLEKKKSKGKGLNEVRRFEREFIPHDRDVGDTRDTPR